MAIERDENRDTLATRRDPSRSEDDVLTESIVSSQDFDTEADLEKELLFLHDVPLTVTAELGHLKLSIKELLSMQIGTVLQIDKLAGEPLDILINERLVCRGEVIAVTEKYGVRMTDIVDPNDLSQQKRQHRPQQS